MRCGILAHSPFFFYYNIPRSSCLNSRECTYNGTRSSPWDRNLSGRKSGRRWRVRIQQNDGYVAWRLNLHLIILIIKKNLRDLQHSLGGFPVESIRWPCLSISSMALCDPLIDSMRLDDGPPLFPTDDDFPIYILQRKWKIICILNMCDGITERERCCWPLSYRYIF